MGDWVFPSKEAELEYLETLTRSSHTPDSICRANLLRHELVEAAAAALRESWENDNLLERMRGLLPHRENCYTVLGHASTIRLPEEPSVLFSQAPRLRVELVNMQADVNVYLMSASAAIRRINMTVDNRRGLWYHWSPTEEKHRLDAEFNFYAAPLLSLQTDAEIIHNDCDRVYWMLSNLIGQLERTTDE